MYSLQRECSFKALTKNLARTLDSLSGLVLYSGFTGFMCAVFNTAFTRFAPTSDHPVVIAAGTAIPLVVMYRGLSYAAKDVYENFQKDRARVAKLALALEKEELEKEKLPAGFMTPEQMSRIKLMNEFYAGEKVVNLDAYRVNEPQKQKVLTKEQ